MLLSDIGLWRCRILLYTESRVYDHDSPEIENTQGLVVAHVSRAWPIFQLFTTTTLAITHEEHYKDYSILAIAL